MGKRIPLFILFLVTTAPLFSQQAWWVFFSDKNHTTFDPCSYFAPGAIQRREVNHLSLYDSTDFPVNADYLAAVGKVVDTLGYVTRWFNGVGVVATPEEIEKVKALPFVRKVCLQNNVAWRPAERFTGADTIVYDDDGTKRHPSMQTVPLEGNVFAMHKINGTGIVIAVLDVGFHGVDVHNAFAQLRFNGQIRLTYDFVRGITDVYTTEADHGTAVLSCLAGEMDSLPLGLAPGATYLLGRIAKDYGNQYRGEERFLAGVEWADKNGANIINCSGGPNEDSYFPEQMDGKTSIISRAARVAARKGILVVAAAGNEGETYEPNLLPPSDVDSVLTVTALNDSGFVADYSSRGPMPDFSRKPDLSAPGTVIAADGFISDEFDSEEGTSFSAPLVAGFAACIMEMFPNLTAMQVADTLRKSGSLYPYFDYAHGYGTPQAACFFHSPVVVPPTFSFEDKGDGNVTITIDGNSLPDCCHRPALLFYSEENRDGKIFRYAVIEVKDGEPLSVPKSDFEFRDKLHVFYRGYYATKIF